MGGIPVFRYKTSSCCASVAARVLLAACGLFGHSDLVLAGSAHVRTLQGEVYQSTRAAGMAGVGVCHVSDGDAAMLNPALIGGGYRSQSGLVSLSFPALSAESTQQSLDFADSLLSGGGDLELSTVLGTVEENTGIHYRAQMFPNFVVGRLFFGVLQTAMVDAQSYRLPSSKPSRFAPEGAQRSVSKAADVFGRSETMALFGFAVPMGKHALLGATTRYGLRSVMSGTAELGSDTEKESTQAIEDGSVSLRGYAVDAGVHVRLLPEAGIVLGLVGRNVGGTSYERSEGSDPLPEYANEPADLDVGLAWVPEYRRAPFAPALSIEVAEVLRNDLLITDKVRFGLELAFGNRYVEAPLALRVGHNLLGPSFGASVDLALFKFEAAVYTEDVHLPSETRNEMRYLIRTSWDFGKPVSGH